MQVKTSILIDSEVWHRFRLLCLSSRVHASTKLEHLMKQHLAVAEPTPKKERKAARA